MLCSSGGNQLMSIQAFQISVFLGNSFSQSSRSGINVAKRSLAACHKVKQSLKSKVFQQV